MIKDIKPLFIMTVKENSKRVKGKNLRMIGGKPLFLYSFGTMLQVARLYKSSIILATESDKIVEKALKSSDYSRGYADYYRIHKLDKKEASDPYQIGDVCKIVLNDTDTSRNYPLVMVQATNLFINTDDIHICIKQYIDSKNNRDFIEKDYSIRAVKNLDKIWHRWVSNDLCEPVIYQNMYKMFFKSLGSIVVCDPDYVKQYGKFPPKAIPYIMPKGRDIDIDDEIDFLRVKAIMENKNG